LHKHHCKRFVGGVGKFVGGVGKFLGASRDKISGFIVLALRVTLRIP